MTTTDTVLLIVLTSLLSVFFLFCIAALIMVLKLLSSVRQVVAKADDVVDSVEAAADAFKDVQGRMAFFKLVRNIMKLVQRSRK
ncbi:MAG TPA: hypothetical protein VK712_02120 [Verrucomicrobiae bacterium]|jgi:hypothetical protein|nr:hypothetical protein [Verrucomicrobiae bacterium]